MNRNVRGLTKEDLVWADYAFIRAMIVQRESAREIIAIARNKSHGPASIAL